MHKQILILVFVVALGFLLSVFLKHNQRGSNGVYVGMDGQPISAIELLNDCEQKMRLKFPGSTVVVGYYYSHGLDDTIYLCIKINDDDLEGLINSMPTAITEWRPDRRFVSDADLSWWQPEKVKKYLSGQVLVNPGRALSILINKGEECEIYLRWNEL